MFSQSPPPPLVSSATTARHAAAIPSTSFSELNFHPRRATIHTDSTFDQGEPIVIHVHVFNRSGELVGPIDSPKVILSDADWRKRLTPEQFEVLRSSGTERPFCGTLLDNKLKGVYSCAGCGLPLFSSDAKFHSGTGWPS